MLHADDDETSYAQREFVEGCMAALRKAGATVHTETFYRRDDRSVDLLALAAEGTVPRGAYWYLCGGNGFLQDVRAQLEANEESLGPVAVNVELFSPNDWLLGE